MREQDDEVRGPGSPGADAAAFAAAIEAAWAAGEPGWEQLRRAWGVTPGAAPTAVACWWEAPPWEGRIADDVFRAIVALYVAAYGTYTPDLPSREPGLLRAWLREHAADAPPRVAA
jgi:hypothetical protein